MPPVTAPITGMIKSPTSEFTIPEKAAPMMTPTARSTTLPRSANFLNSSSIGNPFVHGEPLVDQAGMNHGFAHGGLGFLRQRHHRQPHVIGDLAEQRQR